MSAVGRLAPTPSGVLHLGNAVAFAAAWLSIRAQGGSLWLRIEDVDVVRSRRDVVDALRRDLSWLGLTWDQEVPAQSTRCYAPWLEAVSDRTYRCECTRSQLRGTPYPGSCRDAGHAQGAVRFRLPEGELRVIDRRFGPRRVDPSAFGDPILQRRDGVFTYNLAVVADDIADGVTEVARGADLLGYTGVQIRLWEAFGATPPRWLHAPLVLGSDHRKLSKSHSALGVAALREAGWLATDVWRAVLPWLGLAGHDRLEDAVTAFRAEAGPRGPIRLTAADAGASPPARGLAWVDDGGGLL
jgi:glutamyl/glutaminyl-tRNA synthetase